jgi:hypothetical protein
MLRWLGRWGLVAAVDIGLPALALSAVLAKAALAEPVVLEGLTFSDELGGLVIQEGWGSGTLQDPFVLVEEINGKGPAILVIRGMVHRFGNRIGSHHDVGFALTKIIQNATKEPWALFNLELREFIERASPFGDGLSFGQASEAGRPFSSDAFADNVETREPYDGVQFSNGMVQPGERVAISFVVTDTTPQWQFFLLQKRDAPIALAPARDRMAAADAGPAGRSDDVIASAFPERSSERRAGETWSAAHDRPEQERR